MMTEERKTILVTGATGGIGSAVCNQLAKANYSLVCVARDVVKLGSMCDQLSSNYPGTYIWMSVDMTNDASILEFSEELSARKISLDGAVLMPPQVPPTNNPLPSSEAWREILQNSFVGPLALLKVAIAAMKPNLSMGKRAKIAIISGISSAQVLGHYATSNVIRLAWLAQAKTLAFALGEQGFHINTLSLGGTLTPHYNDSLKERAHKAGMTLEQRLVEETANIPLKKYGTPKEVAKAVEGLLSEFSDHITGMNIMCDGGFTRAY
jgi:3-oxoacyl-[acyl-carrier protein] reductase